jgi:hypothetical protein
MDDNDDTFADDLLRGAPAIAEYVYGSKKKQRRVYQDAETGAYPIFYMGKMLCSFKSEIKSTMRKRIAQQGRAAAAKEGSQ